MHDTTASTILAIALATIWTSCSGVAGHPAPVRPDAGVVHATGGDGQVLCSSIDQLADAARVALVIDGYFDLVSSELGYARGKPVEIWLDPTWPLHGTTFERCIVFNPEGRRIDFADLILAHEFVHWHAEDTPLQRNLPHTVVEGLCEVIAANLVRTWQEDRRALYAGRIADARERDDLPLLMSRLTIEVREWLALPDEERVDLYALGFVLVERIGIDALREAAERGPVTPADVLALAKVAEDLSDL